MTFSAPTRIASALAIGCLAFVVVGSNQEASGSKLEGKQESHHIPLKRESLPAVVHGVPLLGLAKSARGAAEAYAVSKPLDVRAVVTTQAVLYAQVPTAGGSTEPEYLVTLGGRFSCGYCGTAMPTSTTTIDPAAVPISTMVLQLPIPYAHGTTTGVAVGLGSPKLAKLGHTYDLDPYIKSLAGVPVRIGPVPG